MTTQRFSIGDLSSQPFPYLGLLKEPPEASGSITDPLYSITDYRDIQFTLVNGDNRLTPTQVRDLRNRLCSVTLLEAETGQLISGAWTGKIHTTAFNGRGEVECQGSSFVRSILDQRVPTGSLITTALFPNAIAGEVGKVAPVIFGRTDRVKCLYVNDGIGGVYDYVIARGTVASVTALWRDDLNQGATEDPPGTQSFRPIAADTYTVVLGAAATAYPFYTYVRFTARQVTDGGALVGIYADVQGFQSEKHPIRGIQYLLSIDTDSWGLGQTVDTVSFDAAAAAWDGLTAPDTLTLDGILGAGGQQRPASEYLREFLQITGARLSLNSTGAWAIALDTPPEVIDLQIGPDMLLLDGAGRREWLSDEDRAKSVTLKYRLNNTTGTFQGQAMRTVDTAGREIILEMAFIQNDRMADRVVDRLAKRLYYAQETITGVRTTLEGWNASHARWVAYSFVPNGCWQDIFAVRSIRKGIGGAELDLERTSPSIWQYAPTVALPVAPAPPPISSPPIIPPDTPPSDGGVVQETFAYVISGQAAASTSYAAIPDWYPGPHATPPSITVSTAGNDLLCQAYVDIVVIDAAAAGETATVRLRDATSGEEQEVILSFVADPFLFPGYTSYIITFTTQSLFLQQTDVASGAHTILLEYKTSFSGPQIFWGSRDLAGSGVGVVTSAYVMMRETS